MGEMICWVSTCWIVPTRKKYE